MGCLLLTHSMAIAIPSHSLGSSHVPSFIVNGCGKSEMGLENRLHGGQLTGMEERQEMSEVWERQAVSSNGVLSRDLDSGDQS